MFFLIRCRLLRNSCVVVGMPVFMLFLRGGDAPAGSAGEAPSPAEIQAYLEPYQRWLDGLRERGDLIRADRLESEVTLLGPGDLATDTPSIETKDLIDGYYLIRARNAQEALKIAKDCPHLRHAGTVEVRKTFGGDT